MAARGGGGGGSQHPAAAAAGKTCNVATSLTIFFNLLSVGLWAGWEYIGLRYIYQYNTVVTAIVRYSGLVD